MEIQYIGLAVLDQEERSLLEESVLRHYQRAVEKSKMGFRVLIHCKMHHIEGRRKKYSLHLKALSPTIRFVTESVSWDLAVATRELFRKLEHEIEHTRR